MIELLYQEVQKLKERLNDIEDNDDNRRRENRYLKDRISELESQPDHYSEDNCSRADSLEREYTKERLRS